MVTTEHINKLWLKLSTNPELTQKLRAELEALYESRPYQDWWGSEPLEPYELSSDQEKNAKKISELGLKNATQPTLPIKINKIGAKIFITDGAWVKNPMRVFPDPDEALVLLKHVEENNLTDWPDYVIDTGAGCGHTPLGFNGRAQRIFCDANARALTFASINALLNGMNSDECFGLLNDMNKQLPSMLKLSGKTLFLANVPFAPAPDYESLAINSGGGPHGSDLQLASFRLVKKFHEQNKGPVKACFLTWTLGSLESDEWEVPRLCREVFPDAEIRWSLEHHDYDAPELPNPAPLAPMLQHLAESQYAVDRTNDSVQDAYRQLAETLLSEGFTHIAYGFLDCDLDIKRDR